MKLYCNNNQIKSTKYLIYIPLRFWSDINITSIEICKNMISYGLYKIYKIFKNKQVTLVQKTWQTYWYDVLIDVQNVGMNRFGYYCWKQM